MRNDTPGKKTVKFHLDRVRVCAKCLKRINTPHGDVGNEEKGYELTTWFITLVIRKTWRTTESIKDEYRLQQGLYQNHNGGCDNKNTVDAMDRVSSCNNTE